VEFVDWLSEPLFVDPNPEEPGRAGDKSLLPHIQTRLETLGMPPPGGRLPASNLAHMVEIGVQTALAHAAEDGELAALAGRLRVLTWTDGVRPPEGYRADRSVRAIVDRAAQLQGLVAGLQAGPDDERNRAADRVAVLLKEIAEILAKLLDHCKGNGLRNWLELLGQEREAISRLLAPVRRNLHDTQAPYEPDPMLAGTLRLLHEVGREIQARRDLNMGMPPLEIFCACYMAGEDAAVQVYPRFPAWRDAAVARIEAACRGRPEHEWMCESNTVRNLVRIACWGAMFEHGRNRPPVLEYYKRWLQAVLRDGNRRLDVDKWFAGLLSNWAALPADDRVALRPPTPFTQLWDALDAEARDEVDAEDDRVCLDPWPLNAELRIDELAKERREAGVAPTSTASRWLVTEPLPAGWIPQLHQLARVLRAGYPEKWTVALASKLGYFAVLPPEQRDEPRTSGAVKLLEALRGRVVRMGSARGLSPTDEMVKALCKMVDGAIDVNATRDSYRSVGRGRAPRWWMYGKRYADYVHKQAQVAALGREAFELARALYCEAVWRDYEPRQALPRMMQYLAGLAEDDNAFGVIWNQWVFRRPADAHADGEGA
jgi:hypothetical protein